MTFDALNSFGKKREPFLFITDFKAKELKAIPLCELLESDVEFAMREKFDYVKHDNLFTKNPVSFEEYEKRFDFVVQKIKSGETYLLNLTQPTKIETDLSLKDIYDMSNANYKLRYKDEFVCFSPEKFIEIEGEKIHTYPMKGTIDASLHGAKEIILANQKEMAEHVMVVDLLRNDLSMVAKSVKVEEFRYVTEIKAGEKSLLQVSSHVSGILDGDWHGKIGDILNTLLPAGSISGTPKKSTLDIIDEVEGYERGYFSGVFGVYDGVGLKSSVMIRFIEKTANGFVYKSGGGITIDSDAKSEYDELLDKVYLP